MAYDKNEVKECLTIEDIYELIEFLGGEPRMINDNFFISKTICHCGDSHKLYYYDNTQLFFCYTKCGDSFDIFDLVSRVNNIDLNSSVFFVVNFFNLQGSVNDSDDERITEDWKIFKKWNELKSISVKKDKIEIDEIENAIKNFPQPYILNWQNEFITKEVCDYMGIRYEPINGSILIPHYDYDNRLIGIRSRTLVKENEKYGKYLPYRDFDKIYNHPLGFNLYGLNVSKNRIKDIGIAIVSESEKAVLQTMSYLGIENNICVAMCGSTLSSYQFKLLLDSGAKEICIAIDKDYEKYKDDDYKKIWTKMNKMYKKFSPYCKISFMFDKENLSNYKDSPMDCGKDAFFYFWNNRIIGD